MPRSAGKNRGVPQEVAAVIAMADHQAEQAVSLGFEDRAAEGLTGATAPEDTLDAETVAWCAMLDHSDTDNAKRLKAHFGTDLAVMAQEGTESPPYGAWAGTHWDFGTGPQRALAVAQRLGGAIAAETRYISMTEEEEAAVKAWTDHAEQQDLDIELDPGSAAHMRGARRLFRHAAAAQKAYASRRQRRNGHAETSKNIGRMQAALSCLVPHILRDADAFNADPLRFASQTHTCHFEMGTKQVTDDPMGDPADIETVRSARLVATEGHSRTDWITDVAPVGYDPDATCPRWDKWLAEFSPDPQIRGLLQVSTGLGLLGVTVQRLFFHYGKGANGKSVFMETISRVIGDLSVTLPAESITGRQNAGGGPSPDLARLYGRRLLRVAELPQGEPLRIELIKKLTGGERIPVRGLFKGYFDFLPVFVAHMSGNGYPRTDETDNGTWRRLVVIPWPVTVPTDRQRDFEDVMADFAPEYPGILNWLIEGARMFLEKGLIVPESAKKETQAMRETMDPLSGFVSTCLVPDADADPISAADLYSRYTLYASENAQHAIHQTSFGRKITGYNLEDGSEITKTNIVNRVGYKGVRFSDYTPTGMPSETPAAAHQYPDGYGG